MVVRVLVMNIRQMRVVVNERFVRMNMAVFPNETVQVRVIVVTIAVTVAVIV